jgi:hypothetical protein
MNRPFGGALVVRIVAQFKKLVERWTKKPWPGEPEKPVITELPPALMTPLTLPVAGLLTAFVTLTLTGVESTEPEPSYVARAKIE